MGCAISFDNLTLGYDRHPAVHHLDTTLAAGSLTALVGPNGAGKSTLMKAITGVLKPLGGRIVLDRAGREDIAYLPQRAAIDRDFPACVLDFVAMGLWRRIGACRSVQRSMNREIDAALKIVGLTGFERRLIGTLSEGQMQRALFSRLALQDAQVVLLDEPFAAVDAQTTAELMGA